MTMFLIIRDISSFSGAIYNLFQKCGLSPPNCFFFQFSSLPGIEFCMLCCHAAKSDNSLTHVYIFIPIRLIARGPDEAARCSGVLCWQGKFGLDVGPVGNLIQLHFFQQRIQNTFLSGFLINGVTTSARKYSAKQNIYQHQRRVIAPLRLSHYHYSFCVPFVAARCPLLLKLSGWHYTLHQPRAEIQKSFSFSSSACCHSQ